MVGVDYLLFQERGKGMIHNDALLVPPSTIRIWPLRPAASALYRQWQWLAAGHHLWL
jgi:hypothetical protein